MPSLTQMSSNCFLASEKNSITFESGPVLREREASNEELSTNFHCADRLGQRNVSMTSAPLGMLCLDSCLFLACAASAMEWASL